MNTIFTDGMRFVDEFGRERIFHGINVCDKGRKVGGTGRREYDCEWDEALFEQFRNCGFNIIRFGITWDAVEPQPGKYNDDYLDSLAKILDKCAENGFYCYLDMHQDLYSSFEDKDGFGDGAPAWACLDGGHKYKAHRFVWAEGYFFNKAVHKCFDSFWANAEVNGRGLQDWYCDMWAHVVGKLGSHPAVIGFDVMNEPFMGSDGGVIFRKLILELIKVTLCDRSISLIELAKTLLIKERRLHIADQYTAYHLRKVTSAADSIVRRFDTCKYTPFINKAAEEIRRENKSGIIFLENSYYSNLAIPCAAGEVTVGGKRDESFAYAPHAYDIVADTPMYKYAGTDRMTALLAEPRRMQERLNIPVVFGEWGGFQPDTDWYYHCEFILDTFDKYHWSDTYWAYFDGLFDSELPVRVLKRPYPRAVAGRIIEYRHDRSEGSFSLRFEQDKSCKAPTEIYAHKAVRAVESDLKYTVTEADGGYIVAFKGGKNGIHDIKITFCE